MARKRGAGGMSDIERLKNYKNTIEIGCWQHIQSTSNIKEQKTLKELYFERIQTFENAISALEKQIPKKPIKISEDYNVESGEWVADYECPSCGNPYADDSFCSCCGQALDWSDTE